MFIFLDSLLFIHVFFAFQCFCFSNVLDLASPPKNIWLWVWCVALSFIILFFLRIGVFNGCYALGFWIFFLLYWTIEVRWFCIISRTYGMEPGENCLVCGFWVELGYLEKLRMWRWVWVVQDRFLITEALVKNLTVISLGGWIVGSNVVKFCLCESGKLILRLHINQICFSALYLLSKSSGM